MAEGHKKSLESQLVRYRHTGRGIFVSFEEEFETFRCCQLSQPGEAVYSCVVRLVEEALVGAESLEEENLGIRLGIFSFDGDADKERLQLNGRTVAFGERSQVRPLRACCMRNPGHISIVLRVVV